MAEVGIIRNRIGDQAVIDAANKAAVQYENERLSGKHPKGRDVVFNSNQTSAYTNLLNAICSYAVRKKESGLSPRDENTSNVKAHPYSADRIDFDQLAVILYDVKQAGGTVWKYAPYGLVYPDSQNLPTGIHGHQAIVSRRNSGSREGFLNVNTSILLNTYVNMAKNQLSDYSKTVTGSDAAGKINTVLTYRKKLTSDFNTDIEGDNYLNDYCRVLCNRLKKDTEFREGFFQRANDDKQSEVYRWLLAVGYNKQMIWELSGYKN